MNKLMLLTAFVLTTMVAYAGAETGKAAPDFQLKDLNGKEHALSDFKGKVVVLEWTNYGCPFVKKHYGSGNMQALQKKYTGKGVVWLTICSSAKGKQGNFTVDEWRKESEKTKSSGTAILPDPTGGAGKAYGATATPHMFVIDTKGILVYQGAIDSNSSFDPKTIEGATNYVADAVDAVLAGKDVSIKETKAYGCSVKY